MFTKIRNARNWFSGLQYKDEPFGHLFQYTIKDITALAPTPSEHTDWAIKHGRFDKLKWDGTGQRVAILDTGCDIRHPDLEQKVFHAEGFIPGDKSFEDECGHGTFCTGEIVGRPNGKGIIGVAPGAKAMIGKVIYGNHKDSSLNRYEQGLANAIKSAVDRGCGVISMSLGSSHASPIIAAALEYAVNRGCIPFAAAGNEGMENSPYASYPASFHNCISVGASDERDLPAWFTTIGRGSTIESRPELSISSLEYYWGILPNSRYGRMIGTSMACPIAAGVALRWRHARQEKGLLANDSTNIVQFRNWIKRVANDTNNNGYDHTQGWGALLLEDNELDIT